MKYLKKKIVNKISLAITLAGLLIVGVGENAKAQVPDNPLSFEARAGYALTSGDLSETSDAGFDFGLKLGYFLSERLSFRVDFEGAIFPGGDDIDFMFPGGNSTIQSPDTQIWTYTAGLGYALTDRRSTQWRLVLNAGLGASTVTYSFDEDGMDEYEEVSTNFAMNYGAKLGYGVTEKADIFLSVMGISTFGENIEDDTATLSTIPVTIGMDFRF